MNGPHPERTYKEHVRLESIRKRPYEADETPYPPRRLGRLFKKE
jgi:hypothetical protein